MAEILRLTAFTDDPAGGNPAGVVLDATGLDDAAMLAVAAEVGYSETAFVLPDEVVDGAVRIRYFSPRAEVDFCGHATVATAVALARRDGAGAVRLATNGGEVGVRTVEAGGAVVATLTSVPATSREASADETAALLAALRWDEDALAPGVPVGVAYAGNHHPVVTVATRETLAGLDYDYAALDALMAEHAWTTVQVVWREDARTLHARDPFPPGGVREDPATGAAAAALGAWLRDRGELAPGEEVTVRQGEDMGRPSLLRVRMAPDGERVEVSGGAVPIVGAGD